jgi:Sec-independent protein translocase protein TatA
MSKVKADSRASTQPHVTLEEITTLRNHWMNIAHDFDLLHELYGEGDPRVVLVFGTSKLPSLEQMQKFAEEVRRLFETIKTGTTNQRGQSEIRFTYERLRRLRNNIRVAIQRSRDVLQIQFPDDNQENDVLASESLRTGASCPDSYQLRNPSYEIEVEPQSPSHIPRPSQSSGRPRQLSSTSPDTPPIARRLNPGYSGPFSPTLPSDPNSSQRPSHLNPQAPRPDRDDIQCLRDENRELRAENDKLREQHQEEKDRLNDWFKLQEQEIDQKDKEVEHLKKEKEELKKENKELRERKREN